LIDELADLGGRSVTLSGGEALLHSGFRTILNRAVARNLGVQLLTNGTLLDREWVEFLGGFPLSVQVSIDGSRAEIHDAIRGRGSFEKALRAVEHLQEAGLGSRLTICATVMQGNARDLPEIIHLGERIGVPLVRFLPLRKKGRAAGAWDAIGTGLAVEDAEAFYRLVADRAVAGKTTTAVSCGVSGVLLKLPRETSPDEIWCPVGRKIDVDFNGDAYPCVLLMEEGFRLGNVHRDSLASMVKSERMRETCSSLVRRRTSIGRCASCLWQNLCQAGCMGQALDNTGTIWGVDDFCNYRQQAYAEAFDKILALEAAEPR
jgi:radical SAM protein with 4Fe4S-binding SPASM domain